jgi:methionyl-tRNA formyltransferase
MVRWALLYGMAWAMPAVRVADLYRADVLRCDCTDTDQCAGFDYPDGYDLVVTVAWRHMVPDAILSAPLGVVGFHSAKLPEYPGRAPVAWTLLRGDERAYQTMLYLTSEPDAGDIIDERSVPVAGMTAADINAWCGRASAEMLSHHLSGLRAGTAPRTPQDRSLRGPLTTADGWRRLA